jgi:hypothetical protein
MVVPVFTSGRQGPTRVPIQRGVGGLTHDSVLFYEELTTLAHDFLEDGPLGPPVSSSVLDRVTRAVRRAIGEVVVEPEP